MSDDKDIDFIAFIRIVWEYKYFIFVATTVGAIASIVAALVATPIFRADVVITEVHDNGMNPASALMSQFGGLATMAGINLPLSSSGHNSQATLTSRHLAEEFIRSHALLEELSVGAKLKPSEWEVVRRFREQVIEIKEDTRKGVTVVSINWTDPVKAASWANGYIAYANDLLRERAINDSKQSIAYLNQQIQKTDVVEVRGVLYKLIEDQTKTLMLANVRTEFAFAVVDPAVPPEMRSKPRRTLMVLVGTSIGLIVSTIIAFIYNAIRPTDKRLAQSA